MIHMNRIVLTPREINVNNLFGDTFLHHYEGEMVARRIVFISQLNNIWMPFSWEEYKEKLRYIPNVYDIDGFVCLKREACLKEENGFYYFLPRFFELILPFKN